MCTQLIALSKCYILTRKDSGVCLADVDENNRDGDDRAKSVDPLNGEHYDETQETLQRKHA